jgi:hypothetical protein
VENQTSLVADLTESLQTLGDAIEAMSKSLKACRNAGMNDGEIRDAILFTLPEDQRPAFLQQWPMLSMMFTAML